MLNKGSMMRTTIDDLTERIQFLSYVNYRNEQGDILRTEESVRFEVWAKVLPVSAPLLIDGAERRAQVQYRVIVRYRDDIMPDDVLLWGGRRLKVSSTPYDVESRRTWTAFDCVEAVQDGDAETE